MDESNVTCDAVINAVQTILTPTQFSVFGKHPKVTAAVCYFLRCDSQTVTHSN